MNKFYFKFTFKRVKSDILIANNIIKPHFYFLSFSLFILKNARIIKEIKLR